MPDTPPPPVIHFYNLNDDYGCFSNFSRHTVFLNGKRWPTSEHYFQAHKHYFSCNLCQHGK